MNSIYSITTCPHGRLNDCNGSIGSNDYNFCKSNDSNGYYDSNDSTDSKDPNDYDSYNDFNGSLIT